MTISLTKITCFVGSIYIKGADTKNTCTKGANIRTACTKDTCIRNGLTYTSDTYIGAWGADIGDTHVRYAGGIDTVICLEIYLQLSQIL